MKITPGLGGASRSRVGALIIASPVPAAWGLIAGWWTPRGPVSSSEALWSVLLSVVAGLVAGLIAPSRWAVPAAPLVFAAAVEVARLGETGSTVDRPHASAFGLLALVSGRGVHGLLSMLPLAVGAAYGVALARRSRAGDERRTGGRLRRYVGGTVLVVSTVCVLLVTVAAATPARTEPITGPGGARLPGSVAELVSVPVAGRELGLMIRGRDRTAPVVLYLHGGPGSSDIGVMRRYLAGLEDHAVVATLDRRGAAKSYAALDPVGSYTMDALVDDTIAVTNYLRERFHREKIYLIGHSGGSFPAVLAVRRRPELYQAYVGTGQGVDLATTDRIQYDDTVAWARAHGRQDLVRRLVRRGPPPYRDFWSYEDLLVNQFGVYDYDRSRNARA